jgi:hypothetical protein
MKPCVRAVTVGAKLLFVSSLMVTPALRAESPKLAPVMTTAGDALTNDTFAGALPKAWRPGKGTWTCESGVIRGVEVPADKHQAVMRRALGFTDAIVTFQFRLDKARQISLSINDAKEHVCRLIVTPRGFTVQKDDHDHDGPDKAVVFARVPLALAPGEWHTAVVEISGPNLVAQIDDGAHVGFGAHELIDRPKANFGLTVAGGPAEFRDLKIVAATPRVDWAETKARLSRVNSK